MTTTSKIAEFLLDYADALLSAGAQTSRIVRNVCRLAEAFDCKIHLVVFPKTLMMTLERRGEEVHSAVRKTRPAQLNFRILTELRILTWETLKNNLSMDECRSRYEKILKEKRNSGVKLCFFVALANASFCYLLGGYTMANGGFRSSVAVFTGTFVGFFLKEILTKYHVNHLIVFTLCAFVSSFIAGIFALEMQFHTDLALSTSVLFLVPGVPLLNGVIDLIDGHVLAGVSRIVNATALVLAMTLGLIFTVILLGSKTLL